MGIRLKTLRGLFGDMDGRRWLVYIALTTITTAIIGIPLYFAAKKWFLVGAEVGWLMAALGIAVIFNGVMFHKAKSYAGLKTFDKIPLPHMALVDWPKPSPSCPASADRA
jgi:undecaprenyl-diphosphatase